MRELTRHRNERGAVGILFGVLLGTGVLFGLVALTFDFGRVNASHSQLQSAADAAALQAARTCASTGTCPAPSDLTSIANANDNSPPHHSSVLGSALCGNGADLLRRCTDDIDNKHLQRCPTPMLNGSAWTGDYVEVHVGKNTDDTFANAPNGGSTSGQACASVAWGKAKTFTGPAPFTFSVCEWQEAVGGDPLNGGGLDYAPAPPYPPYPDSSYQHPILLESKTGSACTTFNGHDAPGGFGWLDTSTGCQQTASLGGWVQGSTGNSVPNGCKPAIEAMLGHVVPIPVYDCTNTTPSMPSNPVAGCKAGNGTHLYYHIVGYAGFYVTGWQLPGTKQDSIATGGAACGSGEKCVEGFFVKDVVPGGIDDGGGSPDFGLTAIQTIG